MHQRKRVIPQGPSNVGSLEEAREPSSVPPEIMSIYEDTDDEEEPTFPLSEYKNQRPFWTTGFIYFMILIILGIFMYWVTYYNIRQLERLKDRYGLDVKPQEPDNWWQKALFYQIYVRSYKDTNGDGIGDIKGITAHIDHLLFLGIDCVIIGHIFESPMIDLGKDISDFTAIDPLYGTQHDFKELVNELHDKGIRIILELGPNQTSKKHNWFQESRKGGQNNKYTDYYIWHSGRIYSNGSHFPPNNWLSKYGGSAWSYDLNRKQYYYHLYHSSMPDLNHRNPHVKQELDNMIGFWLKTGIDGIMLSDIQYFLETDDTLIDEEPSDKPGAVPGQYDWLDHGHTMDHPDIHDYVANWREYVDHFSAKEKKRIPLILNPEDDEPRDVMKYYITGADCVTSHQFQRIDRACGGQCVYDLVDEWRSLLPDEKDSIWRIGSPEHQRLISTKGAEYQNVLNMLMMLLPGAVVSYYGEEIGLQGPELSYMDTVDILGKRSGEERYKLFTRDGARAPFPWNAERHGGFTKAEKPWLPLHELYTDVNVQAQREDKSHSDPIHIYGKLSRLRKEVSFTYGQTQYATINNNVFSFMRFAKNQAAYLITLNFGDAPSTDDYTLAAGVDYGKVFIYTKPNIKSHGDKQVKSFTEDSTITLDRVTLLPGEGLVLLLLMDIVPA